MRHQSGGGVDRDGVDFLRRIMRDAFNIHAALGGGDHRDTAGGAVNEQREIEFIADINAVGNIKPVDLLASFAGLNGHQRIAEHIGCRSLNLFNAPCKPHAALGIGAEFLEFALAASASMNLRFHHIEWPGQFFRGGDSFFNALRGDTLGDGNAMFGEQFFGLIFMDIHRSFASLI